MGRGRHQTRRAGSEARITSCTTTALILCFHRLGGRTGTPSVALILCAALTLWVQTKDTGGRRRHDGCSRSTCDRAKVAVLNGLLGGIVITLIFISNEIISFVTVRAQRVLFDLKEPNKTSAPRSCGRARAYTFLNISTPILHSHALKSRSTTKCTRRRGHLDRTTRTRRSDARPGSSVQRPASPLC